MTVDEILHDLSPQAKMLGNTYLPILSRWIADAGWEAVRKALYVQSQQNWYRAIRKRMTPAERDADDTRAKATVRQMAVSKAQAIAQERSLLQSMVTLIISALLAKI